MNLSSESIVLNSKQLASYSLVFNVNYKDNIIKLSDLSSKDQVRIRQFESFYQQNNFVYIDMLFANVLADIVLDVYLGKVFTFYDYIHLPKSFQLFDKEEDMRYFNSSISQFVDYLLYSDIAKMEYSSGELNRTLNYTIKCDQTSLQFNELNYLDLIQIGVSTLTLRIDLDKSYVTNLNEVILCLVIAFDSKII